MDVSVKGLEPEVVERLAEQAKGEGVSAQEWMRQALRRRASLLTPNELAARASQRTAVSAERYDEVVGDIGARRAAATAEAVRTGVPRRSR